ncbi:hypothetical protein CAOG_009382 [Capsaspora owczarzaki ATCC 30864]|uniref:Uncharacterized protein n=1 Tax=Capsaspora owczarzaki (strain ATCC 30864) TaxID=595528 RepID=A0A0D2U3B3_CAPO3|nr:hypothetical protein CAOG_009382 [Capsaspora owczarzaki ATCC 30864]
MSARKLKVMLNRAVKQQLPTPHSTTVRTSPAAPSGDLQTASAPAPTGPTTQVEGSSLRGQQRFVVR